MAAAKFQVDSIRRMFHSGEKVSAVYACGNDRPSWNPVAELAMAGERVLVLFGGPPTPEMQTLAGAKPNVSLAGIPDGKGDFRALIPRDGNLLVIDEPSWQHGLLRDVLGGGARPAVIVARDVQDAAARQTTYALLTQSGYFFSGVVGEHSLWASGKQPGESEPSVLAELPPEIRALPLRGTGDAQIDQGRITPGEVLRLSARAAFEISGWAMIAADQAPAADLFAVARHDETGVEEYMRLPREPRRDVVDHFRTEQLLMTGFRADLSPLLHRMGTHSVSLVQSDGSARYESAPLFQFAIEFQSYELAARVGLANRYIRGSGIEIGALQKPMRLDGACQVRYIDRMPLDKLLEHYPEMAAIPVQAPDIIDDGQQLAHIAEDSQDFVIANHFLEHCPDPIRSIHTMLRVVRQGGILYLAVPDKRHTFDLRRPVTPYAVLKAAYVSGQRSGRADLFYEWASLVYRLPPAEAKRRADQLMAEDYSIHYNVWATGDLLSFLISARHDFQIPFEVVAVVSSENETIVLLERTGGRLPI